MTAAADLKLVAAFWSQSWPGQVWPHATQVSDLAALQDFEPSEILRALHHFRANDARGFRPSPGQLRAILGPEDSGAAERAWCALLRAVAHYAGRPAAETVDMPAFADPRCADTVAALGGFRQYLGGIEAKDRDYLRARFVKAYGESGHVLTPLLGDARAMGLDGRGPAPEALVGLIGRISMQA